MSHEHPARDALRGILGVIRYPGIGYESRRATWDPGALDVDLAGKVCVVTGASEGLGLGIAEALAARRATVVIASRDATRGEEAARAIAASTGAERVVFDPVDVSSVATTLAFAARIASTFGRIDVLVNNAGAVFDTERRSADDVELTFATNVLGGFVLTRALLPLLRRAAPARIVHVGSSAQYLCKLDTDALVSNCARYRGERVYAHTKRAVAELSARWAKVLEGDGITCNCMHPGLTLTPGVQRAFPVYGRTVGRALRTLAQGADTAAWLAISPAAASETGGFWFDRARQPEHVFPWTRCAEGEVDRLWSACEHLAA